MSTPVTVSIRVSPKLLKRLDALVKEVEKDPDVEGRVSRSSITRQCLLSGVRSMEKRYGIEVRRKATRQ